jgi:glutathione peroxidase
MSPTVYDFSATSIEGQPIELSTYKGKVLLIVNTASECGYTSQYKGLQELYAKHVDKGLVVLGFPCNQFGQQEPGSSATIKSFCESRYGVTFPLFEKIDVKGAKAHPLYVNLTNGEDIEWNFAKFLVGSDGNIIKRYPASASPQEIETDIARLLS